jgi:hypothetical protein
MCIAALRSFNHLIYDVLRSRLIWVTHTKIDNVLTRGSRLLLEVTCDAENVWGESIDAREMVVHVGSK